MRRCLNGACMPFQPYLVIKHFVVLCVWSCWAEWEVHHAFQKWVITATGDGAPFRIHEGPTKIYAKSSRRRISQFWGVEKLGGAPPSRYNANQTCESDFDCPHLGFYCPSDPTGGQNPYWVLLACCKFFGRFVWDSPVARFSTVELKEAKGWPVQWIVNAGILVKVS